jgi:hypothetical protein
MLQDYDGRETALFPNDFARDLQEARLTQAPYCGFYTTNELGSCLPIVTESPG